MPADTAGPAPNTGRGIVSHAGYVPYRRLDRGEIAGLFGAGGGKGTRAVASYDEDTTSMAVEAGRIALRSAPHGPRPDTVLFCTTDPAYADKCNASTIHAALRLDRSCGAYDVNGSLRGGVGALRLALDGRGTVLAVTADIRTGPPTSSDESAGGDGAAAMLIGDGTSDDAGGELLAQYLGGASVTEEFVERWRTPGDRRSRSWEERFGEFVYGPLAEEAWEAALEAAGCTAADVDRIIVTGMHARAASRVAAKLAGGRDVLGDDLTASIGNPGAAQPALLLSAALEQAEPGQVIALAGLADGVDIVIFRTTPAVSRFASARPIANQIATCGPIPYGKFLSWRGVVEVEPPNRPEPTRPSSAAVNRRRDWKFGFVGSRDRTSGVVHLPPARAAIRSGTLDEMDATPMADIAATIVTFTVDRLAYSPSPPVVFAVVDFDGGGRMPCELTDIDPAAVRIGDRVEMTFRRLYRADGISNYFWKARPIRSA